MASGYILEDGEIKISLDEVDFLTFMEEAKDCKDLLLPYIRIEDNYIIFRDRDVKMIIPEEVFIDKLPEFVFPETIKNKSIYSFITVIIGITGLCWYYGVELNNIFSLITWVGLLAAMMFIAYHSYLKKVYVERHRKALYIKAKFFTYLLMIFVQDITTTSTRLTRTSERMVDENEELKNMIRMMYGLIPEGVKVLHIEDHFPDGEPIMGRPKNKFS